MTFELPKLAYAYDALEPFIDAKTMEVHHSKHHQTYTDNFNAVIAKYPDLAEKSAEEILKNLNSLQVDEKDRAAIKNQGGGYLNHKIFWEIMSPQVERTRFHEIPTLFRVPCRLFPRGRRLTPFVASSC